MDLDDLHPIDDYSHRFFIWHEWIKVSAELVSSLLLCHSYYNCFTQANGPLTDENVFDYFATSMFYDKQSSNQALRMQTMTGQPLFNEADQLKYALTYLIMALWTALMRRRRFTGIEFALVSSQAPFLFVIHKRERLSPEEGW